MKKNQIIQESLHLFMQYGIRSVSMDDVCRRLGISKKTLYNYVDSKSDLVKATVQTHQEQECEMMQSICEQADNALEEMVNIGHYIVQLVKKTKPSVMYDMQKYYRQIYDDWQNEHSQEIHDQLVSNLNNGIKEGYYRPELDVEVIARLYVGKVQLIMDKSVFPNPEFEQENVVRQHFIYHLHGILTVEGLKKMYDEDLLNIKLNS